MKIFVTSPWVPPEWIEAHGLDSRGIWTTLPLNAAVPAAGVCGFAEAVLQRVERDQDAAYVFTTHCDQLRRTFDVLAGKSRGRQFLFNLPATYGTDAALDLFADELSRLSTWLMSIGGCAPSQSRLRQLMRSQQLAREELAQSASWCSARQHAEAILRFHASGMAELPQRTGDEETPAHKELARVALIGGPFTRQHWVFLDEIEAAGGVVTLNATEAGERSLGQDESRLVDPGLPEFGLDMRRLAECFLGRIVDVFQRPNDRLVSWLRNRFSVRPINGIVLWHYFGCDLWRAEAATLREVFRMPILMLEANETEGGLGRARTRLQAFIETLRGA